MAGRRPRSAPMAALINGVYTPLIPGAATPTQAGLMSAEQAAALNELAPSLSSADAWTALLSRAICYFDFGKPETCALQKMAGVCPNPQEWTSVSGWSKTAANGVEGANDSASVAESGTGIRYLTNAIPNTMGPGWCRYEFLYRPGDYYQHQRYAFMWAAIGDTNWFSLPSISALRYPAIDKSGYENCTYTLYQATDEWHQNSLEFAALDDGWIRVRAEHNNYDTGAAWGTQMCSIRQRSSLGALPGQTARFSRVKVTQDRVIAVVPTYGSNDYTLYQATNNNRPVLAPDIWLDGGSVLVESCGIESLLTGELSLPSNASWTAHLLYGTRMPMPKTTNRLVWKAYGATAELSLTVTTAGKWRVSVTNDAGTTAAKDTAAWVSPFPVSLDLAVSADTVALYVDGRLVDSLSYSGAATFAHHQLLGGESQGYVRDYGVFNGTFSAAEVSELSLALRAHGGLPAKWRGVIRTGQSNENPGVTNSTCLDASDMNGNLGVARYSSTYNAQNTTKRWYVSGQRNYTTDSSSGANDGWVEQLYANRDWGFVITTNRGGVLIDEWLPGGSMYSRLPQDVSNALDSVGTHLIEIDSWTLLQGEAEAAYGAIGYADKLDAVDAWMRSLYPTITRAVVHRLNTWLGGATDQAGNAYAADVRAAQDLWASRGVGRYLSRADGGELLGYNVHYPYSTLRSIGRQQYQLARGKAPTIVATKPDYPFRGLWQSPGFWVDCEHGVTCASGATGVLTALVSREGGATFELLGSPTIVGGGSGYSPQGLKAIQFASPSQFVRLVDAVRFGAFGGSAAPLIAFVQYKTPVLPSGYVFSLNGNSGAHIAASLNATSPTVLTGLRTDGNTPIITTAAMGASKYYTVVYVNTGNTCYLFDGSLNQVSATASPGALTIDRFELNAHNGSAGNSGLLVRRFGLRTPKSASTALAEAVRLWQELAGMTL